MPWPSACTAILPARLPAMRQAARMWRVIASAAPLLHLRNAACSAPQTPTLACRLPRTPPPARTRTHTPSSTPRAAQGPGAAAQRGTWPVGGRRRGGAATKKGCRRLFGPTDRSAVDDMGGCGGCGGVCVWGARPEGVLQCGCDEEPPLLVRLARHGGGGMSRPLYHDSQAVPQALYHTPHLALLGVGPQPVHLVLLGLRYKGQRYSPGCGGLAVQHSAPAPMGSNPQHGVAAGAPPERHAAACSAAAAAHVAASTGGAWPQQQRHAALGGRE